MLGFLRRVILGNALILFSLAHGQALAESDFDVRGLRFGMTPAQVKKQLASIGPVSDRTLIEFKWLDQQDKPTGIAGYKFCIAQNSSCKEVYIVGFTEITQQAFHITRVVRGRQIAPLKTLAAQAGAKYRIAKLEQFEFDATNPYWVLFFSQDASGVGAMLAGQEADCAAFAYGGSDFDQSELRMPTRSLFSCPEVVGAIELHRNGQVKDLADSMSLLATNHRILMTNNVERTKRRLQREQAIRDSVKGNKLEF